MGNPPPPASITQETFESDGRHLKRLAQSSPGTIPSSADLYEYIQDALHTKIETQLLRYVLPFCLDVWRQDLRGEGTGYGGMIEYLYVLLAKPEVFDKHLLPVQATATSSFMRATILDEIDDQRGLAYQGSQARPYRWIYALTTYGVLRTDIHLLWNEWWALTTVGRAIAFLQYISSLMYAENENPIFTPWTTNTGGGPPSLTQFAGHLYEHCWLPSNIEFLRPILINANIAERLHRSVRILESEPEFSIAKQIESDWPLCDDFLRKKCNELCAALAAKH